MSLVLFNRAAAEILSYPQKPDTQQNLDDFLACKIDSTLLTRNSREPALVPKFRSGRRLYQCRGYRVTSPSNASSQVSIAVLLERVSRGQGSLAEVSERFHLTIREGEVVQFLFEGLTTKEIAGRLGISPHTVKALLRLIMVKMEVSTRSGVVGKALGATL
jgi:DNA-binding CsgD family transcriptional regulator